jgi:hypothetical protein
VLALQVLFHEAHDDVSVLDCVVVDGTSPDGFSHQPGEPFTVALRHETPADGVRLTGHLHRWARDGVVVTVSTEERNRTTYLVLSSADDELVLEITPEAQRW